MTDFADLGIRVESQDVLRAQGELRALASTGGQAERAIGQQTGRMSATWRRLAGAAGLIGGAVASAFGGAAIVSTLANFDASMAQVQAITRATDAEMVQLRATAQSLGASTEFSASQAADGLRFLGMAGFDASEAVAAIPAVLDLATASGMGLADAADIASNVLSGFGMAAGQAADVADVLAAASSRSNTNVSQLGQAMSTVAPVAASLGIGLADTAAAIGVMSDAGVQGERAGTALRGVLASLAAPTDNAAGALAELGLSIQDVNPEAHSMEAIFGRLRAAGITTAQAMTIFGREAATGGLILAAGSRRLGDFGRELGAVSGESARMAGIMRDTLKGDIDTLKSAIEALILAMGDAGLTAIIRGVVQAITFMVGAVTASIQAVSGAVTAFGDMIGGFEGYFIAAAAAITVYFLPSIAAAATGLVSTLVPAIWGAIAATGSWVASLVTLRGALMLTGIGALVVAAGYAINALIALRERTGSWGEALGLLGDVARGVWSGIVSTAAAIPAGLSAVWNNVRADFTLMVRDLVLTWGNFLQSFSAGLPDLAIFDGMRESINGARMDALRYASGLVGSYTSARNAASEAQAAWDAGSSFSEASRALADLNKHMAEAGGQTVDAGAAVAAINEALANTPGAAGAAADGVSRVGRAAEEAQSRMEAMAGNMSQFFLQIVRGGDAARNALSQLLSRAAEALANRAFMALLGGSKAGAGGGFLGGLLNLFFNADGGIYKSPSLSAYSGQVVTQPTMFAFARGAGVMGEAGPEAILPLKRGSDGKLGVAAPGAGGAVAPAVTFNVDARGAQRGVAEEIEAKLRQMTPDIVRQSVTATRASVREYPL